MPDESLSTPSDGHIVWLSGVFQTFMSKVVMPAAWFALLIGIPAWVYATTGRLSIRSDFEFIVWFALIATVPLSWLTVHLQRVGYAGRQLVVANYWRQARIPFEHIQSVEPVWWYKGRLVRIRFHQPTPFGPLVYYRPKWGPMRAIFSSPEEELRRLL
jgi:hypothetical protein